jgi:hypothetical protein
MRLFIKFIHRRGWFIGLIAIMVCEIRQYAEYICVGAKIITHRTRRYARVLHFESGYRPLMICCSDSIVLGTFVELRT